MKGRALLHHNVQLDDRATLCSVPGVKNGTILRVDKHMSQAKNKSTGKKDVMSGPAMLTDEDVVESIEESGDDEETSSKDERRMSNGKRRRPSKSFVVLAAVDDSIENDNIARSPSSKALDSGKMSEYSLHMADSNLSSSAMALHIAKKGRRENTAHQQVDTLAPQSQKLTHRQHCRNCIFPLPLEKPVQNNTASAHMAKTAEAVSRHQNVIEHDDAAFLAGIYAAVTETETIPLPFDAGLADEASPHRCKTCGRACPCGGDALLIPTSAAPVEGGIRGQKTPSTNSNSSGYVMAKRNFTSQRAESSWTGM